MTLKCTKFKYNVVRIYVFNVSVIMTEATQIIQNNLFSSTTEMACFKMKSYSNLRIHYHVDIFSDSYKIALNCCKDVLCLVYTRLQILDKTNV